MHRFTFLSVLLSFGTFAASVSADLPYVVSNTTAGYEERIDSENDLGVQNLRKYFVRTDGMELEPRDIVCSMYSQLGNIHASFRSNPLSLDALFNDRANYESFEKTLDDLEDLCSQEVSTWPEKCVSAAEALLLMEVVVNAKEVSAFYKQQFRQTKETVAEVLTKPEMCGEGWKHGQKYLKARMPWSFEKMSSPAEKKGSPVIRIPL